MEAKVEQIAELVASTPLARSLIVQIPPGWKHPAFPMRTFAADFQKAGAHRANDLSAKRNVGLLLARLHGWNKITFVDDDITFPRRRSLARLARQLDDYKVAGMVVRDFPDNSVVCHARRLVGLWQDVFVTGAVLGVRCDTEPMSFFPDVYNEDWFFFAEEAASRDLPSVGDAKQARYDPFASPERARREEFGDLLAEGLYAWIGLGDPATPFDRRLSRATRRYWSYFIQARRDVITEVQSALQDLMDRDANNDRALSAVNSLAAAERQLETITADLCVNFIEAWRDDLKEWQRFSAGVNMVGSTRKAMDFLELKTWTLAEFGAAFVDSEMAVVEREALRVSDVSCIDLATKVVNSQDLDADAEVPVVDPGVVLATLKSPVGV
jgi:hypothetical protein